MHIVLRKIQCFVCLCDISFNVCIEYIQFYVPKNTNFYFNKNYVFTLLTCNVGMAMGRVRVRFLHTRTRPASQDLRPGLGPFTNWIFFPGPRPAPAGPHGPCGPIQQSPFKAQSKGPKP